MKTYFLCLGGVPITQVVHSPVEGDMGKEWLILTPILPANSAIPMLTGSRCGSVEEAKRWAVPDVWQRIFDDGLLHWEEREV